MDRIDLPLHANAMMDITKIAPIYAHFVYSLVKIVRQQVFAHLVMVLIEV